MNSFILDRKRLTECREKMGITKQEAAKRMQLSQPAYLRYESGERTPSIHVIQAMANVLSTSTAYLIGKSDDSAPNCYYIQSSVEPELFHLIESYRNSDEKFKERMLAYFYKFQEMMQD